MAKKLSGEPYFKPLEDIPRMSQMVTSMVRDALRSFVDRDLNLVRQVCEKDQQVDDLWHALMEELIQRMEQDPRLVRQATALLLVARYLERIGDHATNVAERVHYTETGELVQIARPHRPRLDEREPGGSAPQP
jgi:phosphate transport system protein